MGAGASVLLVGTATPPASELVRWSAFMPWAEITHFPLSPHIAPMEAAWQRPRGARGHAVACQTCHLSSLPYSHHSLLHHAQQRPRGQDLNCPEFGVQLHSANRTPSLSLGRKTLQLRTTLPISI